jgi:hypothetical protein
MKLFRTGLNTGLLALMLAWPAAFAQDGVQVGKMSPLRKIVPTGALEQQAAAQYAQTLNQAKQQNALAAENDPQLQRLRAIAKRIIPFALPWNAR